MLSLPQKIALQTLITSVGRMASGVLALAIIGLIARTLGPEGFGAYSTVLAYLALFVILSDLGLQSLLTREISRGDGEYSKLASAFFTLRLVASAIFLLAGFGIAFFLPYPIDIQLGIGVALLGFFFLSLNQLLLSIFQKHLAMHLYSAADILGRAAQFLLVYFIYRFGAGPRTEDLLWFGAGQFSSSGLLFLFLSTVSISSFFMFLFTILSARKYVKIGLFFNLDHFAQIIKVSWPIALSIVLTLIYFKIDTIFLSLMKPQEDVGIYGVAYRVLESLTYFPAIFAGILMPILSYNASVSITSFRKLFEKSFDVMMIFTLPVVVGGVILAYSIAALLGGEAFIAAGAPLQALMIATGIIFFGNIFGRAIIALDLQKKAVFTYLFGVVLNIILNFIFIPKYTYMGAAWTTVATELLVIAALVFLVWQKTKIAFNIKKALKAAFAAGVMGLFLIVFIASPLIAPLAPVKLALAILLGGVVYFATLFLVKGVTKEEITIFLRR